jgi:DNA-binding LacI/PurR family transcriptional regulator
MDAFQPFDPQRAQSLPRQIADHLRNQILEGRWSAGERLPTARELAEQLQADAATVHRALVHLTREGLVERKRRTGTFVRQRRPVLETVGIYVSAGNIGHGAAPFMQAVIAAIQNELQRVRLGARFFIDPRPKAEQRERWDFLFQAAARREIQALIVPSSDPLHTEWLTKLPLPLAIFSSGPRHTLGTDLPQFMDLAVAALAAQGCQRIGMISAYPVERTAAYRHFLDVAVDHGLQVRNEWLAIAPVHSFGERGCAGEPGADRSVPAILVRPWQEWLR